MNERAEISDATAITVVEKKRPKSVTLDMADRFGMEPVAFERTMRGTVFPADAPAEEFAAFLLVAKEYDLNPLLKEIYAFPKRGGGIVPMVSVDGWLKLINKQKTFDGMEFEDHTDAKGEFSAVTCTIYRKDRTRPTSITEYLNECVRNTDPWKMRHRMLRHKAMIQCARYAFGFAGIFDEDEAQKISEMRDVTPSDPRAQAKELSAKLTTGAHATDGKGFDPAFVERELEGEKPATQPVETTTAAHAAPAATAPASEQSADAGKIVASAQEHAAATVVGDDDEPGDDWPATLAGFEARVHGFMSVGDLDAFGEAEIHKDWYKACPDDIRNKAIDIFQEHRAFLERATKKATAAKAEEKAVEADQEPEATDPAQPTETPVSESQYATAAAPKDATTAQADTGIDPKLAALIAAGEKAAAQGFRKFRLWQGKMDLPTFKNLWEGSEHAKRIEAMARAADEAL